MALAFPRQLESLYTPACIDYRTKFNERVQRYLRTRLQYATPEESGHFSPLGHEENLIVPYQEVVEQLGFPLDMIATACKKAGRVFILTECHPKGSFVRSVGKTGIQLQLLGVEVPYRDVPSSAERVRSRGLTRLAGQGQVRLVCSDKVYIGSDRSSLHVGVPKGEQIMAQWDLARHIARTTKGWDYDSGEPVEMDYQEALGEWTCLDSGMFESSRQSYPVSDIVVLTKAEERRAVTEGSGSVKELLLRNPYHPSPFWDIDREEHRKRVDAIVEGIGRDSGPAIHRIGFSSEEQAVEMILRLMEG